MEEVEHSWAMRVGGRPAAAVQQDSVEACGQHCLAWACRHFHFLDMVAHGLFGKCHGWVAVDDAARSYSLLNHTGSTSYCCDGGQENVDLGVAHCHVAAGSGLADRVAVVVVVAFGHTLGPAYSHLPGVSGSPVAVGDLSAADDSSSLAGFEHGYNCLRNYHCPFVHWLQISAGCCHHARIGFYHSN